MAVVDGTVAERVRADLARARLAGAHEDTQATRAASERVVRAFDLLVTCLLLPPALLIGALVALIIVVDSPGSVFFRQTRVGKDGRHFRMLKFRKMRRHARGSLLTVADDARFTPIGQLLSLTKLDELPQLWNVLKGEMRLVGPRPEVPEFVAAWPEAYKHILVVTPGLTGPAAVEYCSEEHLFAAATDPHRFYAEKLMPAKIAIDIEYIRTRSVLGDVRILAQTAWVPVRKLMLSAMPGSLSHRHHRRPHLAMGLGAVALTLVFVASSVAPL